MTEETNAFEARRQRRIARRRHRILAAAAQIFAQKGYANATTKEIAAEADMAEGTLYNYFASKREILLAVATETEPPMEGALAEGDELTSRAAAAAMFEKALDISQAQLPFYQTLLHEAWVDDGILQEFVAVRLQRMHQLLAAYIAQQVDAGSFRPFDPALGAQLVMGMFASLLLPAVRGLAPLPSADERRALAETVVDLLFDGVRARPD